MRTFPRVSNELLLCEAIRRLRGRKIMSGGRTAPEGTGFYKLLCALLEIGLMTHEDLRDTLITMLASGEIILTGHAALREVGKNRPSQLRRKAYITKLHADAKVAHRLHFTVSGTPIIAKYHDGRLIYPGKNATYWALIFDRVYLVSDGLPKSVRDMKKSDPVQPY